jgi:hypothetical protein
VRPCASELGVQSIAPFSVRPVNPC